MGYLRHQVDVAEFDASRRDDYAAVVEWRATLAPEWQALIIGPVDSIANACVWFVMLPDGSKEGWEDSDEGDRIREQFRHHCRDRWGRSTAHFWFGDDGAGADGED